MPSRSTQTDRRRRLAGFACLAICVLLIGACSLFGSPRAPETEQPVAEPVISDAEIDGELDGETDDGTENPVWHRPKSSDPVAGESRGVIEDALALAAGLVSAQSTPSAAAAARAAFDADPTPGNRLRLAIYQAQAGEFADSRHNAVSNLKLLLDGNGLAPAERNLAQLLLDQIEQRMVLEAKIARLETQIELLTDVERSMDRSITTPIPQPPRNMGEEP